MVHIILKIKSKSVLTRMVLFRTSYALNRGFGETVGVEPRLHQTREANASTPFPGMHAFDGENETCQMYTRCVRGRDCVLSTLW